MSKLDFTYDKNAKLSGKQRLTHVLDDLRSDILTDDDVAKTFFELNYSTHDIDELIKLLETARIKSDKLIWVNKGEMCRLLGGITERTFDRFKRWLIDNKNAQVGSMEKRVHYKEIDGKTVYYHTVNVRSLYRRYVEQIKWEKTLNKKFKLPKKKAKK